MEEIRKLFLCHPLQSISMKPARRIILGMSLCSATGYILYLLLRKKPDNSDIDYHNTYPIDEEYTKLTIKIRKEVIPFLFGRKGQRIREIERLTNVKLAFKYESDECDVVGLKTHCEKARKYIENIMKDAPVLTTKLCLVPRNMVPNVVGKNNEIMNYIQDFSGAKLSARRLNQDPIEISVKGTKCQVEIASSQLADIIDAEIKRRKDIEAKLLRRMPRLSPRFGAKVRGNYIQQYPEKLIHATTDGLIEVYVSAVVTPSLFYVQIVGPNANELDQLVEEMTDYYSETYYCTKAEPNEGDMVAAPYEHDGKWYRAEVVSLSQLCAVVYFVDYGDSGIVLLDKLFELRGDFLALRYQAIACYLSGIKPIGSNWTDEATDQFIAMTHVAQWKRLSARVSGYRERDKQSPSYNRNGRETSPIPGIDLFDVNNQEDVDMATELVKNGYAIYDESSSEFQNQSSCSSSVYETVTETDSDSVWSKTDTVISSQFGLYNP